MTSASNTYQLLHPMGEVKHQQSWPNYLDLGITKTDIPELHKLLSDKKLHNAPSDSNEVWVPLHAWRALGQLESEESVELLLSLMNSLLRQDDWALEEIPVVLGIIAAEKLTLLRNFLHDKVNDEFARVTAADGIKCVAERHPEKRDECVALLIDYLENLDKDADSLNALVVSMLLDLDATESIETLRKLYKANLIDITHAGDLEDVEIELGLRLERDTPKPHYGKLTMRKMQEARITAADPDDIYASIERYLLDYGNDESILDVSELDGFFTSIISAPDVIPPSQWMPAIWGGEERSPEWEDFETVQQFTNTIMNYYNFVATSLLDGDYQPLFMERKVEDKIFTIVDEWCEGYLRGFSLWPPLAASDARIVVDALEPINLFATEKGFEKLRAMNETDIEFWQQQIPRSATRIYQHFIQQRQHLREPVRVNKVGRNDPCPCGSGKKYKKCCLH